MIEYTVNERGVNLCKNLVGWTFVELHALKKDASGKTIGSKYFNLDCDNGELFLEVDNDSWLFDSVEDLADFLRFKFNTHLEAGAYFYLNLMLKTEFNFPN
jgi:hypothetical protein